MPRRESPTKSAPARGASSRAAALLLGAPFLLSVALLLLNDAVLKPALHDWLTGKLSDFAGLFVFPVLVVALTGWRTRAVWWGTAIAFVVWKSPLVTPLLVAWNAHAPWHLARVVDWSDLIAIVAVVGARAYVERRADVRVTGRSMRMLGAIVACGSLVVVAATTLPMRFTPLPAVASAELPVTRAAILDRLDAIGFSYNSIVYRRRRDRRPFPVDTVDVWRHPPARWPILRIELAEAPESRTVMRLLAATRDADSSWVEQARVEFERDLVEPLLRHFSSHDPLVAGTVYHLRSVNGRRLPVAVPDSECGGRITAAAVEVRHVDTLTVSVSRKDAAEHCIWRSYARLVHHAGDSVAAFDDVDPGIEAPLVLGSWRSIAVGSDLYLERIAGRPLLGVGTDLSFSR